PARSWKSRSQSLRRRHRCAWVDADNGRMEISRKCRHQISLRASFDRRADRCLGRIPRPASGRPKGEGGEPCRARRCRRMRMLASRVELGLSSGAQGGTMITPQTSSNRAGTRASGIVFVDCPSTRPLSAAPATMIAQPQPPMPVRQADRGTGHAPLPSRGREVVVSGKRVKTVDVHAHCSIPEAMAMMSSSLPGPQQLLFARVEDRIAAMDAQGIDVEALSINPFWYKAERDIAAPLIKLQNEKLAEFCAAHRERFVAFATVALQHPDLAVEQLVYGVKTLGLRGVSVGGSVNGEELADAHFHPVWAKAEELGVLVFLHPQGTAELEGRLKGNGGL